MKILTLNLRHNNDYWEQRKQLVIDLIQTHQPDIIGFQEVWMSIQQAHLILQDVDGAPYDIHVTPKQAHHGKEGIAIATRLPVTSLESIRLPGGERVAQRIMIDNDGTEICFVNTHLHHRPVESEVERLPQMQAILKWLDNVTEPTIITGDMNTIPERETIRIAKERYVSAYEQVHGTEPDYTFPAPLVEDTYVGEPVMIDYILISPDTLKAASATVVGHEAHGTNPKLSASDHCGIIATVELV
jgi:endonuclease/exonuclease/phosphatase family metal-dependent hydrolase